MSRFESASVTWIADCLTTGDDGHPTSPIASSRLRSILPAQAVGESGLQSNITSFDRWLSRDSAAQVLVVGKLVPVADPTRFHRIATQTLQRLRQARSKGIIVVADFSDDHFSHPDLGYYWRELAGLIDAGVAASERMAEVLRSRCAAPIYVVPDPISSPKGEIKTYGQSTWLNRMLARGSSANSTATLKLVWYGHPNNLRHLWPWINELCTLGPANPWLLWVVTQPRPDVTAALEKLQQRTPAHGLIDLVEWSEDAQWSVVASADLVLLPSDSSDASSSVKSANRLTDALHAGRPVIASPLHSYLPYADYADLDGDLLKGIADFRQYPQVWRERARAGQAHVAATVGLPAVGKSWANLLQASMQAHRARGEGEQSVAPECAQVHPANLSALSDTRPDDTASPEAVLRLNLGCGDKILPGYVNVDVVSSRAGFEPDVICDLRDLKPFVDDSADEVMAIHVVEHFWRWEVESILREWVRVLKPGGCMVLECPNLLSACKEILNHPESANGIDRSAQRTLWVLYGDPAWRDPFMTHRWAYTPESLAALMTSAGLTDVRQEPAQFKLREPRDMRVIGFKK